MSTTDFRHPAGLPTGGQYALQNRTEADVILGQPVETYPPTTAHPSTGVWDLLDPTVCAEEKLGMFTRTVVTPGGVPHVRARAAAAAALLTDGTRSESETTAGAPISLLTITDSGTVQVREGTGATDSEGRPMLLRKGNNSRSGWLIERLHVLAAVDGHGGQYELAEMFNEAMRKVPATVAAHVDDIPTQETLGGSIEAPERVAAAFLIDGPRWRAGEAPVPGCVFLATDTDDGLVNGFFWAPDGSGLTSEPMTLHLADLETRGGRLPAFAPGSISMTQAVSGRLAGDRARMYGLLSRH